MTDIILDCDPGHDDAIALLLALASPEVRLLGVTTVSGNQTLDKTTANAIRVLDHVGRDDVPVAAGAARPLIRERHVAAEVHGETGLDGPDLPIDLHLTARQAAQHAAQAGAGQLVLTHLVPWNDQARTLAEASEVPLAGPVSLAASGRVIDLG